MPARPRPAAARRHPRRRHPLRSRSIVVFAAAVMAASVLQIVPFSTGVAGASGPSVQLPNVPSVPVSGETMGSRPPDQATTNALSGNQSPGTPPDGGGTSAATPLAPSAAWDVSAHTGDFSWSYPMRVPPAPGGLEPQVALSYRSSAVDGRTSATNNQASWVGDGWDFNPGFVERTYGACATDTEGGTTPPQTGDLCWRSDNATASYGSGGGALIRDDATGGWRAKSDDGSRIERLTGAANGDADGETWKITTTDGTQYFFGSTPSAGSTWTVPVYGDDAGEPCHAATYAASSCTQAWRWNLDKVVDRNGNVVRYTYATETNSYGANNQPTAVPYTRGGHLTTVEYGFRDGGSPSAKVVFAVGDRCVPGSTCTSAHPHNWPDVPWSDECTASTCAGKHTPTFWTTKRLSTVTTQVLTGGVFADVDRWTLEHQFPAPGDGEKAALWLRSVTQTGLANGGSITLPAVVFEGRAMANRVYPNDGVGPLNRYRVVGVVSEAGGVLSVNYAAPQCVAGVTMPSAPESNTLRCYPVTWARPGHNERTDHFHKHVVESVTQSDRMGTNPLQVTRYEYLDGAAWHWDTSEFTKESKKTWNEFRGFARVRVRHGDAGDPSGPVTMSEQRFHRGMHGDKLPSGTRSVTVTDSSGTSRTDDDWLQGFGFESTKYDGAGASPNVVSRSNSDPSVQGPTATRGSFKAFLVRTGSQRAYTALAAGGWRSTRTDTVFDDRGIPVQVDDLGDTTTATDDRCTRTSYNRNLSAWLLEFPARTETVAVRCATTPTFPQHAIVDTRVSYDGQAATAAPTAGNATRTEVAKERPAGGPDYVTTSTVVHDVHGRSTSVTDSLGRVSTTTYTPATGGPVTGQSMANTLGHTSTSVIDPAWGTPTLITDPNNKKTETTYDALGRITEVWLGNRPRQLHQQGNSRFAYDLRNDRPSVVTTTSVGANGVFVTTKTLYDGLLRARQTQQPANGGGRLLTDTRYDSQGRTHLTTAAYFNDAPVDDTLSVAAETVIPSTTVVEHDGAGRTVATILRGNGIEKWRTTTTYGGDRVTVVPPAGGTTTTTLVDARGRTTEKRQHSTPTAFDATTYGYAPAGQLATLTDPDGNQWTWQHDLRGRLVGSTDPDRGTSTMTYDDGGQLITSTDARGKKLTYVYDPLGRKTELRTGPNAENKVASWTYDALTPTRSLGYLATSTRHVGTAQYTRKVMAYNGLYQPIGIQTIIPATEGTLAGTYSSYFGYNPDGSITGESYPAVPGGVANQETVNYVHNDLGLLTSSSGAHPSGGTIEHVTSVIHNRYGEVQRYSLGDSPDKGAWFSYFYDDQTGRRTRTVVDTETPSPMQADVTVEHDPAGNVTSITDAPIGQLVDRQCFRHDHLRRLTDAWTPSGTCAANPSTGALGGPAPYRHSYAYDVVGNRTAETRHHAAGDTTRAYAYTGSQPHALSSVTTTAPSGTILDTYGYDAAGNTTSRQLAGTGETLLWDDEGRLASATKSGQTTSYLYDADGTRLIRDDASGRTLYLGNQEVRRAPAGARTVTRYYTAGGDGPVIAMRQSTGTAPGSPTTLTWLAGDHQGTTQVAVNGTTGVTTKRRQLPFGDIRGAAVPWPGDRGFVGGTTDASTGLTHLGAREYDPTIGRFISVDPILQVEDPQQLQGYAYAHNNPTTWADPTGLKIFESCPDGECASGHGAQQNAQRSPEFLNSVKLKKAAEATAAVSKNHGKGIMTTTVPGTKIRMVNGIRVDDMPGFDVLLPTMLSASDSWLDGDHVLSQADTLFALEEACNSIDVCDIGWFLSAYSAAQFKEIGIDTDAHQLQLGRGRSRSAKAVLLDAQADACQAFRGNSFLPGTLVVMADGSLKPIEKIRLGDKVLATDPETGRTEARAVVSTIIGHGTKQLVEIEVDTDGAKGVATGTVVATANHPVWVDDAGKWVDAGKLVAGDVLLTPAGERLKVTAAVPGTERARVHNLTVEGIHTYYVQAGSAPVLVHNQNKTTCGTNGNKADGVGRPGAKVTQEGLDHSFDRHADQWFGRPVKRTEKMGEWESVVERAARSNKPVPWSSGSTLTNAHLARIDGKWFVAQFSRSSGELVTAFVPNSGQVGAMLRMRGR